MTADHIDHADIDEDEILTEDQKLEIMLNHQDYAFVTSFENAPIMKKELQPLVNLGSFHYKTFILGGLGEELNLKELDPDIEDEDEKQRIKKEIDDQAKEHIKSKVMFVCTFDDDLLDLQAEI